MSLAAALLAAVWVGTAHGFAPQAGLIGASRIPSASFTQPPAALSAGLAGRNRVHSVLLEDGGRSGMGGILGLAATSTASSRSGGEGWESKGGLATEKSRGRAEEEEEDDDDGETEGGEWGLGVMGSRSGGYFNHQRAMSQSTEREREGLDWETDAEWQELYRAVREGMPPTTARFNRAMRLFLKAVQGGLGFKGVHKALELLSLMQACGVAPNIRTYNTFISICAASGAQGSTVAIDYGVRVVKLMGRMGITPGMKPSLRLLTAVASLDSPGKEAPNNVQRGINFLKTMRSAGIELDRRPFDVLVSACSKHGAADAAMDSAAKVISLMQEWGIEVELNAFTAVIQACARSAGTTEGKAGPERARQILNQVEASGLQPDLATYNAYLLTLVRAVSGVSGAKSGRERALLMKEVFAVKAEMEGAGVMPDTRTYATLLHGLAKCVDRELQGLGGGGRHNGGGGGLKGRVGGRMRRFMGRGGGDRKEDDSLIVEWYRTGVDLLGEMAERRITPSEIIYNSMLDLCAKAAVRNDGRDWMKNAFGVYESMITAGIQPSRVTYNTMLDTCAQMSGRGGGGGEGRGGLATAKFLISKMKEGGSEPDAVSYTSFINCARKEGSREAVESAYDIFRALPNDKLLRNKHTYTSMVRALSSVGRWQEAMGLLEGARLAGIRPDRIMYSVCMEAVGHDRDLVRSLHTMMINDGINDDATTLKQLERVERYGTSSLRRRDISPLPPLSAPSSQPQPPGALNAGGGGGGGRFGTGGFTGRRGRKGRGAIWGGGEGGKEAHKVKYQQRGGGLPQSKQSQVEGAGGDADDEASRAYVEGIPVHLRSLRRREPPGHSNKM